MLIFVIGSSLVLELHKKKPDKVPALATIRIIVDPPFGVLQKLGTEWVLSGQTPELAEKVVGGDIVIPSIGHGRRVFRHVDMYQHFLYTAELGQGVDTVATKCVQHLVELHLQTRVESAPCTTPQCHISKTSKFTHLRNGNSIGFVCSSTGRVGI